MRDLWFSSSERRGNGGPKVPKRISGEKMHFYHFCSKKCRNWSAMRKLLKFTLYAPRRKKDYKRDGIQLVAEPTNAKSGFGSEISSFYHFGHQNAKSTLKVQNGQLLSTLVPFCPHLRHALASSGKRSRVSVQKRLTASRTQKCSARSACRSHRVNCWLVRLQNLLPFASRQRHRYGCSRTAQDCGRQGKRGPSEE